VGDGDAVGLAVGLSVGSGVGPNAGLSSKIRGMLQAAASNPTTRIEINDAWRFDRMAASYGMSSNVSMVRAMAEADTL
jgi:hypothetical protein